MASRLKPSEDELDIKVQMKRHKKRTVPCVLLLVFVCFSLTAAVWGSVLLSGEGQDDPGSELNKNDAILSLLPTKSLTASPSSSLEEATPPQTDVPTLLPSRPVDIIPTNSPTQSPTQYCELDLAISCETSDGTDCQSISAPLNPDECEMTVTLYLMVRNVGPTDVKSIWLSRGNNGPFVSSTIIQKPKATGIAMGDSLTVGIRSTANACAGESETILGVFSRATADPEGGGRGCEIEKAYEFVIPR